MNKIKAVAFMNEKIKEDYGTLKSGAFEDKELYKFITRAIDDLKKDPLCGTRIPQRLIPSVYAEKYNINNLWKYDLPNAWRLLYTLAGDEVKIVSIIIEWLAHEEYERRFGY
jgi:Txe/YoeB family toxin of Txe-Axe toxin-antitoxin module